MDLMQDMHFNSGVWNNSNNSVISELHVGVDMQSMWRHFLIKKWVSGLFRISVI